MRTILIKNYKIEIENKNFDKNKKPIKERLE